VCPILSEIEYGLSIRLVCRLTNGAAVRLTGRIVPSLGSGQSRELLVDEKSGGQVEIIGECDSEVSSSLSVNNRDANLMNVVISHSKESSDSRILAKLCTPTGTYITHWCYA